MSAKKRTRAGGGASQRAHDPTKTGATPVPATRRGRPKQITQIDDLQPDDLNANKGSERGLGMLDHSLRKYGAGRSILVDRQGRAIAGNKTLERAAELGFPLRVVETDGRELVVVQRKDLDLQHDPAARELAIADNRVAEVDLAWDAQALQALTDQGVEVGAFFFDDELHALLETVDASGKGGPGGGGADAPEEDPARLLKKWGVKRGDVWKIPSKTAGQVVHRLMCGDAVSPTDRKKLCGSLEPEGLLMDPPYCSGGWQEMGRSAGSIGTSTAITPRIANDRLSTRGYQALMRRTFELWPVGLAYVFTDWRMWTSLFDVLETSSLNVRSMIVWDKGTPAMGRGWRAQHEIIALGTRAVAPFDMKKALGNVIQAQRTGNPFHPTQKPVELLVKIMEVTDFVRVWIDPFAGSGSTMVAAEQVGATCLAMDLDPGFVAVTLERMQDSGLEPRKA